MFQSIPTGFSIILNIELGRCNILFPPDRALNLMMMSSVSDSETKMIFFQKTLGVVFVIGIFCGIKFRDES